MLFSVYVLPPLEQMEARHGRIQRHGTVGLKVSSIRMNATVRMASQELVGGILSTDSHGPSRAAAGCSSGPQCPVFPRPTLATMLWCCPLSCNCNRVLCRRTPAIRDLIRLVVMVSLDKQHSGFPRHLFGFSPLPRSMAHSAVTGCVHHV